MPDEIRKIVCLNLGTRYIGLATFQDQNLLDWRVKTFGGKWNKAKERKILSAIMDYLNSYPPDLVVLKAIDPRRSSRSLRQLEASVSALLGTQGIRVRRYTLQDLKSGLPEGASRNRRTLAEAVTKRWPAIGRELQKEKTNRNPYYQRMFEAVALGSNCLTKHF